MEWILIGLGNPDAQYVGTRHNIGRDFLAHIAPLLTKKAKIITPTVYMNDSGKAVKPVIKSVKAAERLIVLHDDLDLPLGSVRVSFGRGSGGHKGVESIQRAVKTKDFTRIRIGISAPAAKGKVKKPDVLGKFRASDADKLKKARQDAHDAIELMMHEGLGKTMTQINSR
jgi:PTH1 family peptidyl-tRNA hydrolase